MHRTLGPEQIRIDWVSTVPFILVHVAPLGLLATGARTVDWVVCGALYFARMFFITAGYHRYFSHRSYKLGRVMQFLMALGGTLAVQKGVLWWAAHHRNHHKLSDLEGDVHSPKDGLFWSHVGWIICHAHDETDYGKVKDLARYPELVWLNRYFLVPPIALAFGMWLLGGWSMLLCGFFLSTALLYHGTFTINSLAHLWGSRRYVTTDTSRNNFLLALITLGEGWHNNHHYFQSSTRQGFFWWEVDISYYILKMLSWVGLARGLRGPPAHVRDGNRARDNVDVGMAPALVAAARAVGDAADASEPAPAE